jgi:hypothetical protein
MDSELCTEMLHECPELEASILLLYDLVQRSLDCRLRSIVDLSRLCPSYPIEGSLTFDQGECTQHDGAIQYPV